MQDDVCDTNVWYELGKGTKGAAKLKQGGNRLFATGISAIEISTKMTEKDFSVRKATAQAVLDHADHYLKDPDYHFAEIWGLNVSPLKLDWKDVFQTIDVLTTFPQSFQVAFKRLGRNESPRRQSAVGGHVVTSPASWPVAWRPCNDSARAFG
ncbi:MAG: hypothetical protein ACHRXM_08610 [Isosphaerales bacterium]